jgi:WD40 repeat protein
MPLRSLSDDDIFISYSRRDASTYAAGLADELTKRGFSCFIDRLGTDPDEVLPDSLRRRIRGCAMLVVVCTEWGGTRQAIAEEIDEFLRTGRLSSVVPVDFGGAIYTARWYNLIEGIAPERETNPGALSDGDPSPSVVSRIEKQFRYTRRNERLRRATLATAAVLVALGLASVAAGGYAAQQIRSANAARGEAELARAEAAGEKSRAEAARGEADKAVAEADSARADATEQRRLAGLATQDARKKTRLALEAGRRAHAAESSRVVAVAEADSQRNVAKALALANRAEIVRGQVLDQLPTSTLLAAESMRRAPTLEADQALRRGLALMPHLIGKMPHLDDPSAQNYNAEGRFDPGGNYLVLRAGHEVQVWEVSGMSAHPVARLKHPKLPISFAFSPEGKYLVTTCRDGVARVWEKWNTPEPMQVAALPHERPTEDVVISPKGKYVAVGDDQDAVYFWADWNSPRPRRVAVTPSPSESKYGQQRAAFARDESQLLMQINSETVVLLDPETGRRVGKLTGAQLTDDRRFLLSTTESKELKITAVVDGRESQVKGTDASKIIPYAYYLAYNETAHHLAYEEAGNINVIDTVDGHLITKIPAGSASYGPFSFSPDGKLLANVNRVGGVVRIWRVADDVREETARLVIPDDRHGQAIFNPDGRSIVTIGPRSVYVWATSAYREDRRLDVEGEVASLAVSPDGRYVAAVTSSHAYILSAATGRRVVPPIKYDPNFVVSRASLTFSRDGKYLAFGGHHRVWVYADWSKAPRLVGSIDTLSARHLAFSLDSTYLAIDQGDSVALFRREGWGDPKAKPVLLPSCPRTPEYAFINDFIFSHDGRLLITSCQVGKVRLWADWQTDHPREVSSFQPEPGKDGLAKTLGGLAVSPDGKLLAATGEGERLYVWEGWEDDATRRLVSRMSGVSLRQIVFSPDGRYIGGTNYLYGSIWDTLSSSEVSRVTPGGVVKSVAFSHDGRHFIIGGEVQTTGFWLWRQNDMLRKACEYIGELGTSLSEEDWHQYLGDEPPPQTCQPGPTGNPNRDSPGDVSS